MQQFLKRWSHYGWWLSSTLLACGAPASGLPSSPETGGVAATIGGNAGTSASTAQGGDRAAGSAGSQQAAGIAGAGAGMDNATGGNAIGGNAGASQAEAGAGGGPATGGGGSGAGGGGGGSAGSATAGSAGAGGSISPCTSSDPVVTVYTIGDSTMSVYDNESYPRMGWGQPLGDFFTPSCARVVDKALSGRSSKSFMEEGAWKPIKDALKSGDFVLIQFGHNDEKSDNPALYTEPQTTYKQYLTSYVNDTRAKRAVPILLTSINRNNWSGAKLNDTHKAYPPAVRELAQALDVPLIDHEALTRSYFERIGPSQTAKLFLILAPGESPNYPDGVTDNTHLQEKGARTLGQLAMADAYARQLPFAPLLKGTPSAP